MATKKIMDCLTQGTRADGEFGWGIFRLEVKKEVELAGRMCQIGKRDDTWFVYLNGVTVDSRGGKTLKAAITNAEERLQQFASKVEEAMASSAVKMEAARIFGIVSIDANEEPAFKRILEPDQSWEKCTKKDGTMLFCEQCGSWWYCGTLDKVNNTPWTGESSAHMHRDGTGHEVNYYRINKATNGNDSEEEGEVQRTARREATA